MAPRWPGVAPAAYNPRITLPARNTQSPARALPQLLACLLLVIFQATSSSGQAADPKALFLQPLGRFSVGLDGMFGDEGRTVRSALDAMTRGLQDWDRTLQASETAMAAELPRATSATAARMHLAVGAAYLDRGRLVDALREFDAVSRLEPNRADVFTFRGLAHSQLGNDLDRATDALREAAKLDPADPIRAYELGRALSKSGKETEARQAFRDVLGLWNKAVGERPVAARESPFIRLSLVSERSGVEPFFPPVLYQEGFSLLTLGELEKAIDAFRRAVARDPLVAAAVDPREAMGLAAAAFRDGSTDVAAQHLKVAIELEPNRAEAHRLLGRVLLADQQGDQALKELQLAVRLSPDDERARLTLSDALVELRRYPEAERVLRDAVMALPLSGRAHYKLGRLYQRQNQSLEALGEFEAARALNPLIGVNRILQTIGALNAARQNFEAALAAYSTRVDVHPNDAEAHQTLGYTYSRLDRRDEALAEFAVNLLLNPGEADTYVAMSQVYLKAGEYAAAAEAARQAVKRKPGSKQARYALATALMRLDKPDEARQELSAFERLQADETAGVAKQMTLNGLRREASVRSDTGEWDRAVALLRKVLELAPDDATSNVELGLALLKSGQPAEAIDRFKTAERLAASLEIHQHLASAYAALGRNDDSQRELATYRQLRREALQREAER